jgi:hypothetical protein
MLMANAEEIPLHKKHYREDGAKHQANIEDQGFVSWQRF